MQFEVVVLRERVAENLRDEVMLRMEFRNGPGESAWAWAFDDADFEPKIELRTTCQP